MSSGGASRSVPASGDPSRRNHTSPSGGRPRVRARAGPRPASRVGRRRGTFPAQLSTRCPGSSRRLHAPRGAGGGGIRDAVPHPAEGHACRGPGPSSGAGRHAQDTQRPGHVPRARDPARTVAPASDPSPGIAPPRPVVPGCRRREDPPSGPRQAWPSGRTGAARDHAPTPGDVPGATARWATPSPADRPGHARRLGVPASGRPDVGATTSVALRRPGAARDLARAPGRRPRTLGRAASDPSPRIVPRRDAVVSGCRRREDPPSGPRQAWPSEDRTAPATARPAYHVPVHAHGPSAGGPTRRPRSPRRQHASRGAGGGRTRRRGREERGPPDDSPRTHLRSSRRQPSAGGPRVGYRRRPRLRGRGGRTGPSPDGRGTARPRIPSARTSSHGRRAARTGARERTVAQDRTERVTARPGYPRNGHASRGRDRATTIAPVSVPLPDIAHAGTRRPGVPASGRPAAGAAKNRGPPDPPRARAIHRVGPTPRAMEGGPPGPPSWDIPGPASDPSPEIAHAGPRRLGVPASGRPAAGATTSVALPQASSRLGLRAPREALAAQLVLARVLAALRVRRGRRRASEEQVVEERDRIGDVHLPVVVHVARVEAPDASPRGRGSPGSRARPRGRPRVLVRPAANERRPRGGTGSRHARPRSASNELRHPWAPSRSRRSPRGASRAQPPGSASSAPGLRPGRPVGRERPDQIVFPSARAGPSPRARPPASGSSPRSHAPEAGRDSNRKAKAPTRRSTDRHRRRGRIRLQALPGHEPELRPPRAPSIASTLA